MAPTMILPDWLETAFNALRDGDIDGWMALYAADAVHAFPFAPEGGVRRLVGRDAIGAYMRQLPGRIRFGTLSDVRVRQAGDEWIVEATGHHTRVADGSPREISYVWFITRQDGYVREIRDYMNPLQLSTL